MQPTATVLVYSDDSNTREQVRLATGQDEAWQAHSAILIHGQRLPLTWDR